MTHLLKWSSLTSNDRCIAVCTRVQPTNFLIKSLNHDAIDLLEYPFLTITKVPPGFVLHIGATVSARSVKLLARVPNPDDPETRDMWWNELRMEIRSHARAIGCNMVLGYMESTTISKKRKKMQKESLAKKLEEQKARNVELMEELNRMRTEKEASLPAILNTSTLSIEADGVQNISNFEGGVGPSSTQCVSSQPGREESRFMSSVHQLSITSINVPECKPAEEDDIHRHSFEMWRDLLMDSMKLAGIEDETTKFTVFKVKAGPRLLEIFKSTKSDPSAPDQLERPFSNALYRLKSYFGSGSDVMLQRRKLALMFQKAEETDLTFINRVGATARMCDFDEDKEFEQIVGTIAEHAHNKEVRATALKMLSRKGTFTDLVDKVREIEAIRLNEEFFKRKHGNSEQAVLAPVSADFPRRSIQRKFVHRSNIGGNHHQRGNQRFHPFNGSGENFRRFGVDNRRRGGNISIGMSRQRKCWRCDSAFHSPADCRAIDKVCHSCGRIGHLQRACRSSNLRDAKSPTGKDSQSQEPAAKLIAYVEKEESNDSVAENSHVEYCMPAQLATVMEQSKGGLISATVAGMPCQFLIDSGAQVNTFTEDLFIKLKTDQFHKNEIFNLQDKSDRTLKPYASCNVIKVLATFEAFLHITDNRPVLLEKFYVVREIRSLLSRATATRYSVLLLGLSVPVTDEGSMLNIEVNPVAIAPITDQESFPKFNIPPVKISYNKSIAPCRNIFMNIPIAVKPLAKERLHQLVSTDIIEPVVEEMDVSFCSFLLVIPKGKNDIRLVIDLRGPNKYIYRTPFTMPTLDSILADLNGARWFSTIDLTNAFFHIELDEESRHLTTFCTEFGMFRCVRLPFGLCNAPDIFQEVLQRKILMGCKGVRNYLDDILVYGKTKEEHDENLALVMERLREHNVKLNMSKCVFGSQSVKFLGFALTDRGWKVEDGKISAIRDFRRPVSCAEVKSFLGLVTFADRFIFKRADKTEHLRALANGDRFYWTNNEEKEFEFLRNDALKSIKRLGYYDPDDQTELLVDASPIGLGAVLVQFNKSSIPRIIACASKALTVTEQRYPQTHKEALAVVWGVERFSSYLLSKKFVIRTDSEANEFIFNSNHRFGKRAVSRAETWALRLQPYDFSIKRVPGEQNIADALSRLIHKSQEAIPFETDNDSHFLYTLDPGCMELTWQEIETAAEQDIEIQMVRMALQTDTWHEKLLKYEAHKKEMYFLGFLIFKDNKVILPSCLRDKAMASAHGGHSGEVSMKRIMREFFWWPGMSVDVENFVKNCETCVRLSRRNPSLPLASRDLPDGPWEIIQIDFLSIPGCGSGEFLMVVDTYSRYVSVVEMRRIDAESTNAALCGVFLIWGYPHIIQSDNGPPFQSSAFVQFWNEKGVKVRKSIPLSPQSNGAVERQNQGVIKAVAAAKLDGNNWRLAMQQYVHNHNTLIPHSRLGVTPFELLVGWKYRGTFPSLWCRKELDRSDIRERDAVAKLTSKKHADMARGAKETQFSVGEKVLLAQYKNRKTDPTTFSSGEVLSQLRKSNPALD
ncbi:uncharacterized protein LOC131678572 isoform X2 [Topomyia yanbarensis]|uniref:uncharacterized protein LOC131678572 isoform X2 n=1 Tax=Topomyia yanbarensis TaxID=2498891 RepID=UPI00273A809A|nr:uncharacterized protein LOC131678572 isoform X2 [Topomyia yanbarensis]